MATEQSRETLQWLNSQVLVGFTDQNGLPWHHLASMQGEEPTVYPGPIPTGDVLRRIFDWKAETRGVFIDSPTGPVPVEGTQAVVHGMTGDVFNIVKDTYVIHQYDEWLVKNVARILNDGNLHIGSAGLLRRGAGAFVTVELPDNITSRSGVALRPRILAATSHDSKSATVYKVITTIVVCDNTLDRGLHESTDGVRNPTVRTRHTEKSALRLENARETLDLLVSSGTDMVDFVDGLADITVSEPQWEKIVADLVPIPENSLPRVRARLVNKRDRLNDMWQKDPRCAPWKGSALGAFQVFSTFAHHVAGPDDQRFERNMSRAISGKGMQEDRGVVDAIRKVTQR